ncbi:MAG TPA: hypothetical protein VHO71_02705 [Caproiciproducens sp.]|nr:hypothetical protein [Caproiciproducens sp.]
MPLIIAAVVGSPVSVVNIKIATKSVATLVNAVVADVVSIPLFLAIRKALSRSDLHSKITG